MLTMAAVLCLLVSVPAAAQDGSTVSQVAMLIGTITDVNNDTVPEATVMVEGTSTNDRHTLKADESGFFQLHDLTPGVSYHLRVTATGFAQWDSSAIVLTPGQCKILTGVQLHLEQTNTTVEVRYSAEEVATEQVQIQEAQRVLGIIPNFYVVYDANPEPMTTTLKFRLALRVARDPVTVLGIGFLSGVDQAANTPDYRQGWKGYGQRVGANAADGFSNIMIGGAILPTLLHQDPRYFYQGPSYSNKTRALKAMMHPFVCKGDNGRWQVNASSMGGDLSSSALSNLYYPQSNRGAGLVFQNFAIDTAERVVSALVQEFVLPKLTSRGKVK